MSWYDEEWVKIGTLPTNERLVPTVALLGKSLHESLDDHAEALRASAEASDRYARSLTRATWVLAGATVLLFIATLVMALK